MKNLTIREITDTSKLESLLLLIASYPHSDEEMAAVRKQVLKELSEIGDNRYVFGAFRNNEMIAFVQLILKNADNDPDLANGKDMAHVHHLRVRQDLQGDGVGRQMMTFIEEKARHLGKTTLTLGVDNWNKRAIDIYVRSGYVAFKEEQGRTPDEKGFSMRKSL